VTKTSWAIYRHEGQLLRCSNNPAHR